MSDPGSDPYASPAQTPQPHPQPRPYSQPRPYTPGPYDPWVTEEEPPRDPTTNRLAIASLVFGIFAVFPLAIVCAIIALVQLSDRNQPGRKHAIGGLVASGAWFALIITLSATGSPDPAHRDESGGVVEAGELALEKLRVGDCVNGLEETTRIRSLPAVPCAQPHEGEVFGIIELERGRHPGEDAIFAEADRGCGELLWSYAPSATQGAALEISYIYPGEDRWVSSREIVCIAASTAGLSTGSIAEWADI